MLMKSPSVVAQAWSKGWDTVQRQEESLDMKELSSGGCFVPRRSIILFKWMQFIYINYFSMKLI